MVGFASAVHYVHPDKPPQLFINEVGTAETHQRRGLAKQVLEALFEVGRKLGCSEAWVLTDRANPAAMGLYASLGGMQEAQPQVMFSFPLSRQEPVWARLLGSAQDGRRRYPGAGTLAT